MKKLFCGEEAERRGAALFACEMGCGAELASTKLRRISRTLASKLAITKKPASAGFFAWGKRDYVVHNFFDIGMLCISMFDQKIKPERLVFYLIVAGA